MLSLIKNIFRKSKSNLETKEVIKIPKDILDEKRFNILQSRAKNVAQANHIVAIIVEYLNFKEALDSISKSHNYRRNVFLSDIYRTLSEETKVASIKTVFKKIPEVDKPHYENNGYLLKETGEIVFPINALPILLNPWNGKRVLSNMSIINVENPFDAINYSYNIENTYYYPMNIIICSGGNHSQFSARFKNESETVVEKSLDFSNLYDYIYFDGDIYRHKENDKEISIFGDRELIFYSGVIFELGRIILENKYYDCNFPKELINN